MPYTVEDYKRDLKDEMASYSVTSEIFAKKAKKSGSRNRTLTEMNS
jgi:hypothetical protein